MKWLRKLTYPNEEIDKSHEQWIERQTALQQAAKKLSSLRPEKVELRCICAKQNKPYTLRFERQASGLLRCVGSIRNQWSMDDAWTVAGAFTANTVAVDVAELEGLFRCAWCEDASSLNLCEKCNSFVCGGNRTGKLFMCRSSCCAVWIAEPLDKITMERGLPELRAPPARVPAEALAKAGVSFAPPKPSSRPSVEIRPSLPVTPMRSLSPPSRKPLPSVAPKLLSAPKRK